MKPKKFKGSNTVFAINQDEYENLPALRMESKKGEVIICMGLSLKERIRVMFRGRIWVSFLTFNKPLTPTFLSTKKSDHFKITKNAG